MTDHRDVWWDSPTAELARVVHLDLPEPFITAHGAKLSEIQVSYESWGELNPTGDNVVLVVHPMTADCHVTGEFADQTTGWWEPLFGPGGPIDTDHTFVVCPNLIGGCYGTTGPRFSAPDGAPFYDRFPLLTPLDMMRVQRLFLTHLGVSGVQKVIGPSMGGMIAWEWAIEASDMVEEVVVVAAPLRTTAHQIGLNWLQRRGIELDIDENEVVARWGQMVARGVGMLSYRSPTGLEERFGRDWFKRPGTTLAERGVFNVESWLRHHGRRLPKRFDPYTYLLYSRAMDLHDVGDGREGLMAALDRVRCRVLVVGISSDFLYPPEEVHLGADILHHLGRDVRYAEIRSMHGHDAFLLETDQLGHILRTADDDHLRVVPTRTERTVRPVRLGILGAGRVAASLIGVLGERRAQLRDQYGLDMVVTGVAEIDPGKVLDPAFEGVEITFDPQALVAREDVDVIVDLTLGLGAEALVERALRRGRPVVTPNKPLVRAHGAELERLALQNGVRLAYHDSIAAGWPLSYAIERPLARGEIASLHGVLSSTGNVVLEAMERGASLEEAVAEATDRDLIEPDPDLDISGWDTAQKLLILLSRIVRRRHTVDDLQVTGLVGLDPMLVRGVTEMGLRIKLVAMAGFSEGGTEAVVGPMAVPADGHLGAVRGPNHVVVLTTRDGGEIVNLGPGAGTLPVATAVLNDVIGLFVPRLSWTGRYPAADGRLRPPEGGRYVWLEEGRVRLGDRPPGSGAVPVDERRGDRGPRDGTKDGLSP